MFHRDLPDDDDSIGELLEVKGRGAARSCSLDSVREVEPQLEFVRKPSLSIVVDAEQIVDTGSTKSDLTASFPGPAMTVARRTT